MGKPGKCLAGNWKPLLNEDVENELASHIQMLESSLFGLSTIDVRKLAFELAECLKIKHEFNQTKQMGARQFAKMTSAERSCLVTVLRAIGCVDFWVDTRNFQSDLLRQPL